MAEDNEIIEDEGAAADAARINEQCFLIDNMDRLAERGKASNGAARTNKKDNLILADASMPPADVVPLLNTAQDAEKFLLARPAQLAYLVPQLRLYIPSEDPDKKDSLVYFSEYYSPPGTLDKYDGSDGSPEGVIFKQSGAGRGAGVSQFSFSLDNKHPGVVSFMANLEIKFSSIRDLAEGPYVSLISPTGVVQRPGDRKTPGAESKLALLTKKRAVLQSKRKEIEGRGRAIKKSKKQGKNVQSPLEPQTNRLKAIVGWAIPSYDNEDVIPLQDKKFYQSVKSNQIVLLLSMTKYKLSFGETGEATLSIDYAASIEASLSGPTANIFPSVELLGRQGTLVTKNLDENSVKDLSSAAITKAYGEGTELTKRLAGPGAKQEVQASGFWAATKAVAGADAGSKTVLIKSTPVNEGLVKMDLQILEIDLRIQLEKESTSPKKNSKSEEIKKQIEYTRIALNSIADTSRKGKYEFYLDKLTGDNKPAESKVKIVNVPETYLGRVKRGDKFVAQSPGTVVDRRGSSSALQYDNAKTSTDTALGAIGTVLNAEKGEKREEASSAVRVSNKLNPLQSKPSSDGKVKIRFVFFGDLLNIVFDILSQAGVSDTQKIILGTVAVPALKELNQSKWKQVSIADIPISLNTFQTFFLDRVIKPQKTTYSVRVFVEDLLRYILEPSFNSCGISKDGGTSFDSTILSTSVNIPKGHVFGEADGIFKDLRNRDWNSLVNSPDAHEYLIIYSQEKKKGTGNFNEDSRKGVYHLTLGSDLGLVKSISFSQQTNQHLQTQNIVNAANGGGQLGVLALPQDCSITMVGNNLFRTGQTIYLNAEFAMGKIVATELMLGGYYLVTKISNKITSGGFETSLDCRWQNFPTPPPTGGK
jgi:hypothetical protein